MSAYINDAKLRDILDAPFRNKIFRIAEVDLFHQRMWRARAGCVLMRDSISVPSTLQRRPRNETENKGATTLDAARRKRKGKTKGCGWET